MYINVTGPKLCDQTIIIYEMHVLVYCILRFNIKITKYSLRTKQITINVYLYIKRVFGELFWRWNAFDTQNTFQSFKKSFMFFFLHIHK